MRSASSLGPSFERAVLDCLLPACGDQRLEFRVERAVPLLRPFAELDQMLLEPFDRIAERPVLLVVLGAIASRVVAGRMRGGTIRHQLDQRRSGAGARPLRRPLRDRIHREKIIAVDTNSGDAVAGPARCEGALFAAGIALKGRDRPLVVHHVENDRRLVHGGEQQGIMEIRLGGAALARPARGQMVLPLIAAAMAQPTACGNCVARFPEIEKILPALE